MALNRDRISKAAEKYIRSGKIDKAISELEKWVAANPKDWSTIRQIGDLYARIGRNAEAIKKYTQIAEYYVQDGFNVRAIATYKMILRLDPQNEAAMHKLAQLQIEQGLKMEAKSQLLALAELYNKSGQKRAAADVFKKLAEIDPSDLKLRYKSAEFMERQGKVEEAIEQYVGIADEFINEGKVSEAIMILDKALKINGRHRGLRCKLAQASILQGDYPKAVHLLQEIQDQHPRDVELLSRLGQAQVGAGDVDAAESVYRQLIELEPNNPQHASQLADLKIGQGHGDEALRVLTPAVDSLVAGNEGDKAVGLLQRLLNRDAHHAATLVKLVEMHTVLKQDSARIAAYDQLCEAYAHHGDFERAVSVAEQLIELEPENSQHRDRLRFLKSRLRPSADKKPAAPPAASLTDSLEAELPDLEEMEEAMDLSEAVSASLENELPPGDPAVADSSGEFPPVASVDPVGSPEDLGEIVTISPEDEEHIREKLTEAEVFVKYGLVDKAVDQLKDILESFRYHTECREKLIEIYREQGMNREAGEQVAQLARVYERLGQSDKAAPLRKEVQALNPALAEQAATMSGVDTEEEIELTLAPEVDADTGEELGEIGFVPEEGAEEPEPELTSESVLEQEFANAADAGREISAEDVGAEEIPLVVEEEEFAPELGVPESEAFPRAEADTQEEFESEERPVEVELDDEELISSGEIEQEVFSPEAAESSPGLASEETPDFVVEEPFTLDDSAAAAASPDSETAAEDEEDISVEFESSSFDSEAEEEEIVEMHVPEMASEEGADDISVEVPLDLGDEMTVGNEAPVGPVGPVGSEEPSSDEDLVPDFEEAEVPEAALGSGELLQSTVAAEASSVAGELAEVDEYISLGLYEDARDSLRELLKRNPGDAAVLAKIEEVGFSAAQLQKELEGGLEAEEAMSSVGRLSEDGRSDGEDALGSLDGLGDDVPSAIEISSEESSGPVGQRGESASEHFDLASELDLFGTQSAVEEMSDLEDDKPLTSPGLEEIFREFKKGVEKQVATEDYDTRYNLGIAYKEMGLLDEAIAEFQLAAKDDARLLECCSMLGLCFLEKAMPDIAIKWFEKGLQAPGRGSDEYNGLRYDLAQAHEMAGDPGKALDFYMDIYRVNNRFRDVRERVRELQAAKK